METQVGRAEQHLGKIIVCRSFCARRHNHLAVDGTGFGMGIRDGHRTHAVSCRCENRRGTVPGWRRDDYELEQRKLKQRGPAGLDWKEW